MTRWAISMISLMCSALNVANENIVFFCKRLLITSHSLEFRKVHIGWLNMFKMYNVCQEISLPH